MIIFENYKPTEQPTKRLFPTLKSVAISTHFKRIRITSFLFNPLSTNLLTYNFFLG